MSQATGKGGAGRTGGAKPGGAKAAKATGSSSNGKSANGGVGGKGGKGRGGGRSRGPKGSAFGRGVYWAAVAGLWCVVAAGALFIYVAMHLPPIHALEVPKRPPNVQITGMDGTLLASRGDMGGSALALRDMPAHLPNAFIAIEDRRFYSHFGIDLLGLGRAVWANVARRGIAQGGSSITQQLAKNLFLRPERTIMRKLEEVMLALWLEQKFSKREILELYLNRVYFGSGAYGVEAASQRYFGKSAREVSVGEAALLAGLVKSPSKLAPTRNYDGAGRRAQLVLAAMAEEGMVPDGVIKAAMADPPRVVKPGGGSAGYVADWVMDVVNDIVGRVEDDLVVETTIDPALQILAERAVIDTLTQRGEKFGVAQAALVAMTPEGGVRALVGGRNYQESQFNRAVAAKRQPGSAFKPFVYLTAIERGLRPDTVRDDKPIAIKGWRPENYGREYHGPVTLTQALAHSLNTVSVRLTMEFGPQAVTRTAYRLGIASRLEPNASIALGTSEVSVLELVNAYTPFANGGLATVPHVVQRIRGPKGKVLYARPSSVLGRVVEPAYVAMMNQMMRETVRVGTARGAAGGLPGWPVAGKTGTSQDFRDAWFVGFTGHLVTGVWFGNDDNSPTRKMTGGGPPVETWAKFMRSAHDGVPIADLVGLSGTTAGVPAPAPAPVPAPSAVAPGWGATASPAPAPRPAPVAAAGGSQRPAASAGLDGWFLDRLLGR
ncbi:PBP1A family penicillin-binding protein [Rhodoplanes tepidamans]|uniref:peptidoglycan glycosyltransferase n=2 Tax=Rhodoplanes TaxID=29407 RepID=A0ABT5JH46_RHOTP|nr:PBP1A family penicillin-binding protein [Rhodoplanes tepidamans]MDC7789043.1 PBP1A family penicillin-binding protein [Rhodoplanes tepidamans]